jgi:hypothetical protein
MLKNWAVKFVIFLFACFILFGCASLPRPEEMKADVVSYHLPKLPEEGKAIVYVVNPSSLNCKGCRFDVFIDNQDQKSEIGFTIGRQYIYFNLTPGEHKILSKAGNWAEINISAKAGDVIFIQQKPYMGLIDLNNKLLTLEDYEGKYYVKTLTLGTIINNNQPHVPNVTTQARLEQSTQTDTFIGTVTGGNFAKGIGFSNINIKLEVTADNGDKDIFYVRSDPKVFDISGNQINYEKAHEIKDRKVEIEYFTITDATGGDPSRSDFAFEIGKKGVRVMRLLN